MFRQPVFRCFNCIRAENPNYIQHGELGTIIDDYYSRASDEEELHFKFFDRIYSPTVWCNGEDNTDFASICNLASQSMDMIVRHALEPSSFDINDSLLARKHICELFLCCRIHFRSYVDNYGFMKRLVKEVLANVPQMRSFPNHILLWSWEQPNIKQTAEYNLIHFTLDMYWLTITFAHQLEENGLVHLQVFDRNVIDILQHLIRSSLVKFIKLSNYTNLCSDNIYLCSCYKELWLLILRYLEPYKHEICSDFWYYFNKSLMNEMASLSGKDAVACLWVLVNVAQLQGYDSNGIFIDPHHRWVFPNYPGVLECLKLITSADEVDDQFMCRCLHFLAFLQETWWKASRQKHEFFDIIQFLWKFFYKKLNKLQDGNMVENFCDYSILAENILQYSLELLPGPFNSYDIFLRIIRNYLVIVPEKCPELRRIIYNVVSRPLTEFNEVGLHNLSKLFSVLGNVLQLND